MTASHFPETSGETGELDYFVGTWQVAVTDPSSGKELDFRYSVRPAVGGKWHLGVGEVPSIGLHVHDLWGKDPVSGEIVRSIFDSAGTYGTVRSKGWAGATLVLEGDAQTSQGRMQVRETITRVSADEFGAVWEALVEGKWMPYSVEKLTRVRTA
jgi:hypothetical protein